MLTVESISTGYGKKQVLFDVSLDIKQGEIVLLIGSNGSGKTTLLKTIYGLMQPFKGSTGEIYFEGNNITNSRPSDLIGRGLLYVPQKNNCFDDLNVKENFEISGLSLGNKNLYNDRYENVLKLYPFLKTLLKQKPMKLSGGERQILALVMASLHEPKIILLDEPYGGLTQGNIQRVRDIIVKLNKNLGTTILIVEHSIKESVKIADRVVGLKLGKIFYDNVINDNFQLNELNSVFV